MNIQENITYGAEKKIYIVQKKNIKHGGEKYEIVQKKNDIWCRKNMKYSVGKNM